MNEKFDAWFRPVLDRRIFKVIGGKIYDTGTATLIVRQADNGVDELDDEWEKTALYISPLGQYFLAGEGNGLSRWAVTPKLGGQGVKLVDLAGARVFVEEYCTVDDYRRIFGEPGIG